MSLYMAWKVRISGQFLERKKNAVCSFDGFNKINNAKANIIQNLFVRLMIILNGIKVFDGHLLVYRRQLPLK